MLLLFDYKAAYDKIGDKDSYQIMLGYHYVAWNGLETFSQIVEHTQLLLLQGQRLVPCAKAYHKVVC